MCNSSDLELFGMLSLSKLFFPNIFDILKLFHHCLNAVFPHALLTRQDSLSSVLHLCKTQCKYMQKWSILTSVVQLLNKHNVTRVSLFDQL